MALVLVMKRALPSYEDLLVEEGEEEGEIIENDSKETFEKESYDEEFDMGLKAVLPVGKFDEKFREGDVPESGEQYLCSVRSQRKKLEPVVSAKIEGKGGIPLEVLVKSRIEDTKMEVDLKWADEYSKCLERSEQEFHDNLNLVDFEDSDEFFKLTATEWYKKLYETSEIEPNMRVLRVFRESQEICDKLLNLHRRWLTCEDDQLRLDLSEKCQVNKAATWLQALIMCRDSRLTSPEIANLRQLALALLDYGDKIEMKEVVMAVVRKYGQSDLIKYK